MALDHQLVAFRMNRVSRAALSVYILGAPRLSQLPSSSNALITSILSLCWRIDSTSFSISLTRASALYYAGLFPNSVRAPPPLPPHSLGPLTLAETSVIPLRKKQIFLKGASWQSLSLHSVTSHDTQPSRTESLSLRVSASIVGRLMTHFVL